MKARKVAARVSVALAMATLVVLLTVSAALAQSYVEVIGERPVDTGIGGGTQITDVGGARLELAATGADTDQLAILGIGALALGATGVFASRRLGQRAAQR